MRHRPVFVTLGPEGTNHEQVTRRYLDFHGIDASLHLIDDFFAGLELMGQGAADHMVQVAVHPDCADVVAKAHFGHDIHVIDTFISPSQDLAILTRTEVEKPRSLALQPATRGYADISAWPEHIAVSSIMRIADGLLAGAYDSGLTTLDTAVKHPDRLRVDVRIGTVDDPWLVFGRARASGGKLLAWPESPGSRLIGRRNPSAAR